MEADERISLITKLEGYLRTLKNIEEALKLDPGHNELETLKADLLELILLATTNLVESAHQTASGGFSKAGGGCSINATVTVTPAVQDQIATSGLQDQFVTPAKQDQTATFAVQDEPTDCTKKEILHHGTCQQNTAVDMVQEGVQIGGNNVIDIAQMEENQHVSIVPTIDNPEEDIEKLYNSSIATVLDQSQTAESIVNSFMIENQHSTLVPPVQDNMLSSLKDGLINNCNANQEEIDSDNSVDEGNSNCPMESDDGKELATIPIIGVTLPSKASTKYDHINSTNLHTVTDDELMNDFRNIYMSNIPKPIIHQLRSRRRKLKFKRMNAERAKEGLQPFAMRRNRKKSTKRKVKKRKRPTSPLRKVTSARVI